MSQKWLVSTSMTSLACWSRGLKSCHKSNKQPGSVHPGSDYHHDGMSPAAPWPRQPALCSPLLGKEITSQSLHCKWGFIPLHSLLQVYFTTLAQFGRAQLQARFSQYRLTYPSIPCVTCWVTAITKHAERALWPLKKINQTSMWHWLSTAAWIRR